jgi:hypothetical protein
MHSTRGLAGPKQSLVRSLGFDALRSSLLEGVEFASMVAG